MRREKNIISAPRTLSASLDANREKVVWASS